MFGVLLPPEDSRRTAPTLSSAQDSALKPSTAFAWTPAPNNRSLTEGLSHVDRHTVEEGLAIEFPESDDDDDEQNIQTD